VRRERGSTDLFEVIATDLRQVAADGSLVPARGAPFEPDAADREAMLLGRARELAGNRLLRALWLPDGRLAGIVRDSDLPLDGDACVFLSEEVADALARLGGASPLAGARTAYEAPAEDPALAARRLLALACERMGPGSLAGEPEPLTALAPASMPASLAQGSAHRMLAVPEAIASAARPL